MLTTPKLSTASADQPVAPAVSGMLQPPGPGAEPMTVSGGMDGDILLTRTVSALVGGVTCAGASTTLPLKVVAFGLMVAASCGTAGQAVTFTVNGVPAGVETSSDSTCVPFTPGGTVTGVTLIPGGAPDSSCAIAPLPPVAPPQAVAPPPVVAPPATMIQPVVTTTTITPQITNRGTIQATLTPWNVQVQPGPQAPIALPSCGSADYIIQGCTLVPPGGDQGPLRRLEAQAVTSVMQQYQLPDSDRSRVLLYGRNELRAAMVATIVAAFQTPPAQRTADQKFLVDGYTRLVREKHVQAARASVREYQRWKADPCSYVPPQNFEYERPTSCAGGLQQVLVGPESPGYDAFVAYGVARAYTGTAEASAAGYQEPSLSDPRASDVAKNTSTAAIFGYGVAAGVGAGVAAGLLATQLSTTASLVTWLVPFAVRGVAQGALGFVGAAAAIGFVVGVVIFAVTTAITVGLAVVREAAIPGQLQDLVGTAAGYDIGPSIQSCVSAPSADKCGNAQKELFGAFVLSTLPDYPGTAPAPAAQQGDPQLTVAGNTVDWVQYKADDGSQRSFRLSSGSWLVDRAGNTGPGTLTLRIKFQDSSGAKWTAGWVGNRFLTARTDLAPTSNAYPGLQRSTSLPVVDWSGNSVMVQAGG